MAEPAPIAKSGLVLRSADDYRSLGGNPQQLPYRRLVRRAGDDIVLCALVTYEHEPFVGDYGRREFSGE